MSVLRGLLILLAVAALTSCGQGPINEALASTASPTPTPLTSELDGLFVTREDVSAAAGSEFDSTTVDPRTVSGFTFDPADPCYRVDLDLTDEKAVLGEPAVTRGMRYDGAAGTYSVQTIARYPDSGSAAVAFDEFVDGVSACSLLNRGESPVFTVEQTSVSLVDESCAEAARVVDEYIVRVQTCGLDENQAVSTFVIDGVVAKIR